MSSRRSRISVGTLFVLGLFLISVMMCSVTFFTSPMGHNFFAKGCDQVSLMISYIIFERGQELLTIFAVLSVIAIFIKSWQINNKLNNKIQILANKERKFLVRSVVDPVLLSFRQGIIRNLSYN